MRAFQYHRVIGVELTDIGAYSTDQPGSEFYNRKLIIRMENGVTEEFDLFSKNGYNMLVNDNELDSLAAYDLRNGV